MKHLLYTLLLFTSTSVSAQEVEQMEKLDRAPVALPASTGRGMFLTADLLGDWREEIILWDSSDGCTLNIFTTNISTKYRVPTLMHDHTYRMGVAWQNSAYNQPPHVGYFLPDYVEYLDKIASGINDIKDDTAPNGSSDAIYTLQGIRSDGKKSGIYIKDRKVFTIGK